MEKATFAAGCFWGVEDAFRQVKGVTDAAAGYTGGTMEKPTYRDVCADATGHAEAVQVEFDPAQVSYEDLLTVFWQIHDPTTMNRQGPDVGSQYRSAIFFHTPEQEKAARASKATQEASGRHRRPIVTEITPVSPFWRAEEYHQRYNEKHGRSCRNPLRILHLSDRLTDRGGAHWHLVGVIRALHEQGHEVRLAVGSDEGRLRLPCPVEVVPGLEAREAAATPGLDALVRAFEPDVIHVHTVVNPAALEWAAAHGALITVQDHRYFCPTRGKWTVAGQVCSVPMTPEACAGCFDDETYFREVYALTAARLAAIRAMRIVVLSRYMKTELVAAGVPEDRIAVVPPFAHGLDLEARPDGPPCVLFVGRLSPTKGAIEAAEAWRLSRVDLPMLVAGAGPMRQGLEKRGAQVLGWLDHERLSAVYKRARAVVMPSRWQEPFGIAGLEALTMGAPVVAWDSGGVGEWHPGEGLVPWGDVAALALALREAVGRRAAAPSGFDRASLMDDLTGIYREVGAS